MDTIKSTGLGDTIAKITKAIGIKPCGRCKKRRRLLNLVVPYRAEASDLRDKVRSLPTNLSKSTGL
jgi:hypothetical protein